MRSYLEAFKKSTQSRKQTTAVCGRSHVSLSPRTIHKLNGCDPPAYEYSCQHKFPWNNIQYKTIQYNTGTIQYNTIQYNTKQNNMCVCVCVCVFSSHSFWTSSSLDVPAGVTQEEGHTGFLIHLFSAVRALIFLARRIQPFLSLVDREVEFCVLTI